MTVEAQAVEALGLYRAGKAQNRVEGRRTRATSPATTVPPVRITPRTPDLNGGRLFADESTCRFEAGMTARLVKLGDDVGDGIADARDLRKTILGEEHGQRNC